MKAAVYTDIEKLTIQDKPKPTATVGQAVVKIELPVKFGELTAGLGVDIVFECSGVPFGFENSLNFAKYGGQVMVIGIADYTAVSPLTFAIKEIEMKGCFAYLPEEFQMVIDLLAARRINSKPLIGETIALDDIQDKGFQRLKAARDVVKILVRP